MIPSLRSPFFSLLLIFKHRFAINDYIFDYSIAYHRIAAGKHHICVFTGFEASDTVFNTDVTGWIDGNCLQGTERIHAGFDSKSGTKCKILLRDHRCISNDRDLEPRLCEYAGRLP